MRTHSTAPSRGRRRTLTHLLHPLTQLGGHGTWDGPVQSILGLTKMNWNNDQLYDRMPITLQYASKLAATMKSMPIVSSRPYELRLFI